MTLIQHETKTNIYNNHNTQIQEEERSKEFLEVDNHKLLLLNYYYYLLLLFIIIIYFHLYYLYTFVFTLYILSFYI